MATSVYDLLPAKRAVHPVRAKFYPQDPLLAESDPRYMDITMEKFPDEPCLGAGPTSSRVAVVDYNADLATVFEPVGLLASRTGFALGRKKPKDNLKFHQVNVWAVITRTLNKLENEDLFGRRIPWAFKRGRLLVLPHAGYWENAYYDRNTAALHFFYFEGRGGEPVYTCLSHDIVSHELGHAVLDGLKPYYNEVSSAATAGFHEYFGDAVAMTMALSLTPVVVQIAGAGKGDLSASNTIANIAAQFGQAVNSQNYGSLANAYLRSGLNQTTLDTVDKSDPHAFSEVLTGAYYDLLQKVYARQREQEKKRKRDAGKDDQLNGGDRVRVLMRSAGLVARLMLRALDYCPPVDIDYADYARAVIRADQVAYPLDPEEYRKLAADVFIARKIVASPADLSSERTIRNDDLRNLDVEVLSGSTTDAYRFIDSNRMALDIPPEANLQIVHVYRTRKISADGYRPPAEIIVEFVWPVQVSLRGAKFGAYGGNQATLWCGGSLVFNRDGNLMHYVLKRDTPSRREALLQYLAGQIAGGRVGFDNGERGLGAIHTRAPIQATLSERGLELTRVAALRHLSEGGERHG